MRFALRVSSGFVVKGVSSDLVGTVIDAVILDELRYLPGLLVLNTVWAWQG